MCDLFTREKDTPGKIDTKQVLNKRLPKDCAENLQYLDFSNLPCLDYIQVIKILDTFHDILKKKTPEEALQKIKEKIANTSFPAIPQQSFQKGNNTVHITSKFASSTFTFPLDQPLHDTLTTDLHAIETVHSPLMAKTNINLKLMVSYVTSLNPALL